MPIYEYTCSSCETEFEELVFGDETVACPDCKSTHLKKHFSVPMARTIDSKPASACDPKAPPCNPGCCRI